jgi:integrase
MARRSPRPGAISLTDRFIRSRKPAKPGERDEYRDAILPGLALRVTPRGHKSFVLVARYPSNPQHPTRRLLGVPYLPLADSGPPPNGPEIRNGAITLGEARAKGRHWLDLLARGIDPRIEEERAKAAMLKAQAVTFASVAAAFLERHCKGAALCELERQAAALRVERPELTAKQALAQVVADSANQALVAKRRGEGIVKWEEAERAIGRFSKRWALRPASEISGEEVAVAVRAIAKDTPAEARNALGHLSRLYSWALGTHEFGLRTSPTERLRPADLIGKKVTRNRTLSDDELRRFWAATERLGHPYGDVFRMMLLTGQREREVAEAMWSEIDLDQKLWTIPAARMKSDVAHLVPLAPAVVTLLEGLPRWGGGNFVFSTSGGHKAVHGFSKSKSRLDRAIAELAGSAIPPWVLHDLRRTARTHFSALPVDDRVREAVIAHARPGLHKTYDLYAYAAEKRLCLELWAQRLAAIVAPKPLADVADLDKERAKRAEG